ncbi:MAG: penicillin-binding transpeptidase domain-containing protein [Bryobacteraceae bacterium]|jgi:cell division protein FtsI/penicillin-binding protein 2
MTRFTGKLEAAPPILCVRSVGHALACPFAVFFAVAVFAANAQTSYLLLDATHKTVIAIDWRAADVAVPVGSLVKPFTAITYGQRHQMRFPVYECTGADCWLKTGHGRIGLAAAIAHSCNAYFRQLAADVSPADVWEVVDRFGLRGPPADSGRDTLFGVGSAWRLSPLEVARAYAELAARRAEPGVAEVIQGMRLSASIGTAAAIGSSLRGGEALAKTGTAPCSHSPKAAGDGYAVVVYPADSPRYVLLVQVHGVVGRQAAETAARLLPFLTGAR